MANGIANVSYNRENGLNNFDAEVTSSAPVTETNTKHSSFEANAGAGVGISDTDRFILRSLYQHEDISSPNYTESSTSLVPRLLWRHNLGKKHYFELGPEGRYSKNKNSETQDGVAQFNKFTDHAAGVFGRYRYKWLTLRATGNLVFRDKSDDFSFNSIKAKLRAESEWQINDVPVLSILRYIKADGLNATCEYIYRYRYAKDENEHGGYCNAGLTWSLDTKTALNLGIEIRNDPGSDKIIVAPSIGVTITSDILTGKISLTTGNGYYSENRE